MTLFILTHHLIDWLCINIANEKMDMRSIAETIRVKKAERLIVKVVVLDKYIKMIILIDSNIIVI